MKIVIDKLTLILVSPGFWSLIICIVGLICIVKTIKIFVLFSHDKNIKLLLKILVMFSIGLIGVFWAVINFAHKYFSMR